MKEQDKLKTDIFSTLEDGSTFIYDQLKIMIDGIELALNNNSLNLSEQEIAYLRFLEQNLISGRFEVLKAINQSKILKHLAQNPNAFVGTLPVMNENQKQ